MNWHDYFYYDETSPSCLRWKIDVGQRARAGNVAGCVGVTGYYQVRLMKRTLPVHRIIWSLFHGNVDGLVLDHKDNNRSNNKIDNMQAVSSKDNSRKQLIRSNNTTGYKGVSYKRSLGKFSASICIDSKAKHIGYFTDPIDAARAYDAKALDVFGEFALLNFPQ